MFRFEFVVVLYFYPSPSTLLQLQYYNMIVAFVFFQKCKRTRTRCMRYDIAFAVVVSLVGNYHPQVHPLLCRGTQVRCKAATCDWNFRRLPCSAKLKERARLISLLQRCQRQKHSRCKENSHESTSSTKQVLLHRLDHRRRGVLYCRQSEHRSMRRSAVHGIDELFSRRGSNGST